MDRVARKGRTAADADSVQRVRGKLHVLEQKRHVVADFTDRRAVHPERISVHAVRLRGKELRPSLLQLPEGEALDVNLLMHPDTEGRKTLQAVRQVIGLRLVHIPDAGLAVNLLCQKIRSLFSRNTLPDFQRIFVPGEGENRDRNLIRPDRTEIHPRPGDRRLPVAGSGDALFISVSDLADHAGIQASGNKAVRIEIRRSHAFYPVLQLRDDAHMIRSALRGRPQMEGPVTERRHHNLRSALLQLYNIRGNAVVIHGGENNLLIPGILRCNLRPCLQNLVLRIKRLSLFGMQSHLADRNLVRPCNGELNARSGTVFHSGTRALSFCIFRRGSVRFPDRIFLHNRKELSGEKVPLACLIAVIIRAVSVVESEKPAPLHLNAHAVRCILHRISVRIHGADFIEMKPSAGGVLRIFFSVRSLPCSVLFLSDHKALRIPEGMPGLSCNLLPVLIGDRRDFSRHIRHMPVRNEVSAAVRRMVQLLSSEARPVYQELHLLRIRADAKVNLLSLVEIPVREHMHHRVLLHIRPRRLPDIKGILGESRRINDAEVGILRVVRGGLSDVIKSGPEELAHGKLQIAVNRHAVLHALGSPARHRVSECRALFVLIGENSRLQREMVDPAACADGARLRAVDHPVRMLPVMLLVIFFRIIVACDLIQIRAVLRIFPRHVVGAGCHMPVLTGIQGAHLLHQQLRDLNPPLIRVLVIDLIADAP